MKKSQMHAGKNSPADTRGAQEAVLYFVTVAFAMSRPNLRDPYVIDALAKLSEHAHIEEVPDGRRKANGAPLDFVAPSVWHAAAFLLLDWASTRFLQHSYDSKEAAEVFGSHRLYRGQARNWPIRPSAFRSSVTRALSGASIEAFRQFLEMHLPDEFTVGLDEFQCLATPEGAAAVAQHYGLPTHLVDLTFHPLVALHFASLPCDGGVLAGHPLPDHGTVYAASFDVLAGVANQGHARIHNELLPPFLTKRWYQQCCIQVSCEAECSSSHDSEVGGRHDDRWHFLEQQFLAVHFPRQYPEAGQLLQLLSSDIMTSWVTPGHHADHSGLSRALRGEWYAKEPFFEEAVAALRSYGSSAGSTFQRDTAVALMTAATREIPRPWADCTALAPQDNTKLLSEMLLSLSEYLLHAASLHTEENIHLDPKALIPIAQANAHVFGILRTVAEDFGPAGLTTFSEMIAEAADRWNALLVEARSATASDQQ